MGAQTGMQAAMEVNHRMLQQQIQSMADQMQLYNKNKSVLGEGLSTAQERGSTSQVRMQPAPNCEGNHHHNSYTPFPKVEFPHYDGDNTRTWIKKCNRYFQIVSTITEDQKVPLASIHLEGKVELWFQSFMEGRYLPNWPEFTSAILERFDDQDPELIVGEFNKLHQSEEEELTYNQNLEIEEEVNEDFITDDMTISLNALSGRRHTPSPQLPAINEQGQTQIYPTAILARRIIPRNNRPVTQMLVQWAHSRPELATWEDLAYLCAKFPQFDSCGQESFPQGGNVTNPNLQTIILSESPNLNRWIYNSKSSR
ncbi:hypothetical protein BUALT_Bualt03G0185900 [Buddleja alternifolia]|uniref:Retrotransposon gag domain-containing protein n=1 Tax=Buddleja alternifolia TaxID=168488 RepID=A0AAV6Y262_9LAMI|nr:hypothetical protein BUALT_Bualt03G0185900 [Buddleja alternifolia]